MSRSRLFTRTSIYPALNQFFDFDLFETKIIVITMTAANTVKKATPANKNKLFIVNSYFSHFFNLLNVPLVYRTFTLVANPLFCFSFN